MHGHHSFHQPHPQHSTRKNPRPPPTTFSTETSAPWPPSQSPFSKTFLLSTQFPHHRFHSVACFPTPSKPLAFPPRLLLPQPPLPPLLFHTSTLVHLVLQTDLLPVDPCMSRLHRRPRWGLVGRGVFGASNSSNSGPGGGDSRLSSSCFSRFQDLLPPRCSSYLVARVIYIHKWVRVPACKSRLLLEFFPTSSVLVSSTFGYFSD